MSELAENFKKAGEEVQNLKERPDNITLLKLYALFKQSEEGDVSGEPPSGWDIVKRAKYDAWQEIKGLSKEDAMKQYISLVEDLKSRQ